MLKNFVLALVLVNLFAVSAFAAKADVFFTKDISPAGLMAIYEKLGREATGKVAVKLSTGEAGNNHYLDPNLIKDLVQNLRRLCFQLLHSSQ